MQELLSTRIKTLSESQTIAMSAKSRAMKEAGIDVISLSLGEPDFDTPDFVKDAAKQAIDDNYTHYPPVAGYADLRKAISQKFKRDNGLNYSPEQIVVSTGAKQSLANVVLSTINPGDEVIIPTPYWVSYIEIVKLAGGVPKYISTSLENEYKITPAELEEAIGPKSRLMIFSSPCNPSGSVYTQEELEGLKEVIKKHPNFLVMSDEIYELINFTGKHHSLAAFDEIYEQVITVNGVSKAFAMTGWRLGYIGAPHWIAKACTKMQGQFTSAPSSISQKAAQAAVEADPAKVAYMKDTFLHRRDLVLEKLRALPGVKCTTPPGAFYVFPDVSAYFGKSADWGVVNNANDLAMYLLEVGHVAVVTGEAFGNPECIRISYAASDEDLLEACKRIKEALEKLS